MKRHSSIGTQLAAAALAAATAACTTVDAGFSFNSYWGRQVPEKRALSRSDFHEQVVGRAWRSMSIRELLPDSTYDGREYTRLGAQVRASEIFFVTDSTARLYMRKTEGGKRPGIHFDIRYAYDESDNTVTTIVNNTRHSTEIIFVDGDDMLTRTTSGRKDDGSAVRLLEHSRAISYKELAHVNKECQLEWNALEQPRQ